VRLGELIDALSSRPKEDEVFFDFCRHFPTGLSSYRGYYEQLSLHHGFEDYDRKDKPMTVGALLELLRGAVGKTFTGWKGGEFRMDRNTKVWVDNPGDCFGTAVDGVRGDFRTILTTRFED
jgi:hypothetical protein